MLHLVIVYACCLLVSTSNSPFSFSGVFVVWRHAIYLTTLRRVADTNRRLLRSASSGALLVRPTRLVTMGDRAFPVAGSRLWNNLPYEVTSAPVLPRCLFSPAV